MAIGRGRGRGTSGGRGARLGASLAVALAVLGMGGCSNGDGDAALRAAEAQVKAKQEALTQAEQAAADASTALCQAGASYISALDRYGDVLVATAPTVGDVNDAGADLQPPRDAVGAAADTAAAAQEQVAKAEADLAKAEADLAALQGSEPPKASPSATESQAALAPASVERARKAEQELAKVQAGISADTSLREAGQQFNSAVVAVEMAWLQLFAESGCLSDSQQEQATAAAADYTRELQQSLADAGFYEGEIDGVYGPETVDAVQALQKAAGLPQTGTMDKATAAALSAAVAGEGGAAAKSELAATAAVQQTLKLAGYWDGPVDGKWTDELTAAVKELQADLGIKPTGEVDAATIEAFQEALEQLTASPTPSPTPSTSAPTPGSDGPSAPEPSAS